MGTGIAWLDAVLVWGGAATFFAALGGGLWRVVRGILRTIRRADQFMDDWYGEEPRGGVPGRPGVMQRVGEIEVRLDGVVHELHPNGGGSLRDAVDLANQRLRSLCPGPDQPEPECPPLGE
ncbi:hypothetical protein [Streptomyces sp. NPDC057250]|uniref:hypothetical protein n=1 Tax=Streptomyces sp. NPDC057250 TaxID=3346068 RepID=UPI0036310C55